MPNIEASRFLLPLTANHVLAALEIARRDDQEDFRRKEMRWLEENNPWYKNYVGQLFAGMIKKEGIDAGQALMMGKVLANRAVLLCVGNDPAMYAQARKNFIINHDLDIARLSQPDERQATARWANPNILMSIFGINDLVDALMQIRHEISRDSASVSLAYFCLEKIPEAAYAKQQAFSYDGDVSAQQPADAPTVGLSAPEHALMTPDP